MPASPPIGLVPAAGSGLRLGLPYPKELYPIIQAPDAPNYNDSEVVSCAELWVIYENGSK